MPHTMGARKISEFSDSVQSLYSDALAKLKIRRSWLRSMYQSAAPAELAYSSTSEKKPLVHRPGTTMILF